MMTQEKILVAEDDPKTFAIMKRVMAASGYIVDSAENGKVALEKLKQTPYDIVVTDLNMPVMNGMELISHIHAIIRPLPVIIMITGFFTPEVQKRAQELGVHEFLTKPIDFKKLATAFHDGLRKRRSQPPPPPAPVLKPARSGKPPFAAVVIAASTGGPQTLEKVLGDLPGNLECASIFIVQHGPDWMLRLLSEQFARKTSMDIIIAKDALPISSGSIYIAPGDLHMTIDPACSTLRLLDTAKENFVKPSADPLFRSAAEAFGEFCVCAVLSGLGSDGALGAKEISKQGGVVLVQEPQTAVAPFMPLATSAAVDKKIIVPLDNMGAAIHQRVTALAAKLTK